ncbi:MAG: phosphoribosylanthranilate isomerase [Saprospiraceae bacterium]
MSVKIKICCISSLEEAQLAVESGADVLGLVGPMPSGPGVIDNNLIAKIAQSFPLPIKTFLLTSETSAQSIIAHHQLVHTSSIQIVDELQEDQYLDIRKALPDVELIQVIHVLDQQSIQTALLRAEHVDYLLLDSGNPNLAVKELGGTGRTHNWEISREIVAQSPIPVFLAGGLNASNIQAALNQVQPYGVDLCSGVRSNGHLDTRKLQAFISAAQKG